MFAAAFTVARAEAASELCRRQLVGLGTSFEDCLRIWGETSGVTAWSDARAALERVIWPGKPLDEEFEKAVWAAALSKG